MDHPIRERAIGYGRNLFSFFYCVLLDLHFIFSFPFFYLSVLLAVTIVKAIFLGSAQKSKKEPVCM